MHSTAKAVHVRLFRVNAKRGDPTSLFDVSRDALPDTFQIPCDSTAASLNHREAPLHFVGRSMPFGEFHVRPIIASSRR
jgi:hypothetical protein